MGHVGRPHKKENSGENRQKILQATIQILSEEGVAKATIRHICTQAGVSAGTFYHYFHDKDDLFMSFVRVESFANLPLKTPHTHIADRIIELYAYLIEKYQSFGVRFMKNFYSPNNNSIQAYMNECDGKFLSYSVMHRCEQELLQAREQGILASACNPHEMSLDICIIIKGCIFEWCLNDGSCAVLPLARRLIHRYFTDIPASSV